MTTPPAREPAATDDRVNAAPGAAPLSGPASGEAQDGEPNAGTPVRADRPAPRRRGHGGGNWRSLVISMAIITAIVFAWVALMPRPGKAPYAAVDVAASAAYVARQTSWPILVPKLGPDWVPTSVRFGPDTTGPRSWHIGYNRTSTDTVYVGVEQTKLTGDPSTDQAWIDAQVQRGAPSGEVDVAGRRWQRYVLAGQTPRESLVQRDANGLMVVVTGLGGTGPLEEVAASLAPYSAGTAPTSGSRTGASSAASAATSRP